MATNAITGLTTEQEAERQRLAQQRGQEILGGLAKSAFSFVDPTDPLNYLGLFGRVGRALAVGGSALFPTEAEAVVGKRFLHTGKPTHVPLFGKAYEITDKFSSLNPQALEKITKVLGGGGKLKELLSHPSLYRDYPELANMDVKTLGLFSDPGTKAAYGNNTVYLPPTKATTEADRLKEIHSSLLHEVQHAIQELDKMPIGASPTQFLPEGFSKSLSAANKSEELSRQSLDKYLKDTYGGNMNWSAALFKTNAFKELMNTDKTVAALTKQYEYSRKLRTNLEDKYNKAYYNYKNVAGEAQARAVQKRFENPEQENLPFTELYDVPISDLTKSPLDSTIK